MNEDYQQLIEAVAAKLEAPTEHLWDVLVRQAMISGTVYLCVMAVGFVGVVIFYRVVKKKTSTPPETPENKYPRAEWEDELAWVAWLIVFVSGLVLAKISGLCMSKVVTALMNPEYWALKQLIQ